MSQKDRAAMNEIMNSLLAKERVQKISLEIISSTFSSIFVIWRNEKFRMIVNLRRINNRLYFNVYFLSRQNTVLSSLKESMIFFSIDFIKEFFQQSIESRDYWKIIFVSQHRDLKWLTVVSMNLKNTSRFFQSRMKKIFDVFLWKFVLVYIDDIIVYSRILKKHLEHLNEVLNLLKKFEVTLSFKKCHFVLLRPRFTR